MVLLGITEPNASWHTTPQLHPPSPQSALVFIEAEEQDAADDLAYIQQRLAAMSLDVDVVHQEGGWVVLHVTNATDSRWDLDQFEWILVSGNLDIGDVAPSESWQQYLPPKEQLPHGISLATMAPFDRPTFVSGQKELLKTQFPILEKKGLIPFVYCRQTEKGTLQCALQVLNRALQLRAENLDAIGTYVDYSDFTTGIDVTVYDPDFITGPPSSEKEAILNTLQSQKMQSGSSAIVVMDGEAIGAPANLSVWDTGFQLRFESPFDMYANDINQVPSRLQIALNVFKNSPTLKSKWKVIHVQKVNTPVAHHP